MANSSRPVLSAALCISGVFCLLFVTRSTWTSTRFRDGFSRVQSDGHDFQRLRILHLIDRFTHEAVMDRWFTRSHQSFEAQPDLVAEAVLWGRGFEGYDSRLSLKDNLIARFGSASHFDAILPYYNGDQANHLHWDPAPLFLDLAEVSRSGVVIIDRPHEMRDARRVPILDLANVTLLLAPYPNELFDYRRYMDKALLVHQPHPVNPSLFRHDVHAARPRDIFLAGSLEEGLYPLRHRLSRLIEIGALKNAATRPHPGYPDIMPAEDREKLGINAAFLEEQLVEYSAEFGRSKICIVTASRWQYSIQKFSEAAAAGCLIIGTLPADRQAAYSDFVVPISMEMTDEQIVDVFDRWLSDGPARLERARRGQEWTLAHFSDRRYVEDVSRWIRSVQVGQRGLILPYSYLDLPEPLPWDG